MVAMSASAATYAGSPTHLFWGDTHVHTSDSFDALLFGNKTADVDVAYRFARGEPVIHPYSRARIQLQTPLDFMVIADHAETLGIGKEIYYRGLQLEDAGIMDSMKALLTEFAMRRLIDQEVTYQKVSDLLPPKGNPREEADKAFAEASDKSRIPNSEVLKRKSWQYSVQQADFYNEPGEFSAIIGWEWGSTPGGANLHRVIVSTADAKAASGLRPFGWDNSPYPEDLWDWLGQTSAETGIDFIAIPHNSNVSKGFMFAETTLRGESFSDEYINKRAQWERLVEVTQIKGDSETHPVLSPRDEFADFELFTHYVQAETEPYRLSKGDYVRSALIQGLDFEVKRGANPFRFGMIGSTDSHTGLATTEENNFGGKMGVEGKPESKGYNSAPPGVVTGWSMSASGLAAVWAHENTRQSIFDALKRREVYATTGPRISLRLFAGYGFAEEDIDSAEFTDIGYLKGVPMGGDLPAGDGVALPQLMIKAFQDPNGASLDRVQVIKGWIDEEGAQREQIYNVAWSGGREPDVEGNLPAVGNTVNLRTGHVDNSIGSMALSALWTDPAFDPEQYAFYYVRVLQIPTARHSLYDAVALGLKRPPEGPMTIQERAYSSPVWYTPGDGAPR